ncbi:LysR family transcriptional regulator, partial [Vibrio alfacsensis]
ALSYATRALLPKIQKLNERFPDYEIAVIPVIDEEESLRKGDYDLFVFTTRESEAYQNDPEISFMREEYMAPVCTQQLLGENRDIEHLLTLPR